MQFTREQCDSQITKLQKEIPQMQNQLQQLIGYRQALIEMEEDQSQNPEIKPTE